MGLDLGRGGAQRIELVSRILRDGEQATNHDSDPPSVPERGSPVKPSPEHQARRGTKSALVQRESRASRANYTHKARCDGAPCFCSWAGFAALTEFHARAGLAYGMPQPPRNNARIPVAPMFSEALPLNPLLSTRHHTTVRTESHHWGSFLGGGACFET